MGCNYYLLKDVCLHCGRGEDDVHIGKSSYGWSFSFHGITEQWEIEDSGLSGEVVSEEDWKREMRGHQIKDEYGRPISFDDFWKMVDDKRDGLNHCKEVSKTEYSKYCNDWIDKNGSSFSSGEFS